MEYTFKGILMSDEACIKLKFTLLSAQVPTAHNGPHHWEHLFGDAGPLCLHLCHRGMT